LKSSFKTLAFKYFIAAAATFPLIEYG